MRALSGWLLRSRRLVLVAWLALVAASVPFAMQQSDDLVSGGFEVPGSQSQRVHDELVRSFEQGGQLAVVVVPDRRAPRRERAAAARRLLAGVADVPDAALRRSARRAGTAAAAAGRPAVVPVRVASGQDREPDAAAALRDALQADGSDLGGVRAYVIGRGALDAALQELSKKQLQEAEVIGFPIVLLILLAIFGSLAAAALPLLLGGVAVVVTGAAIYFLAQALPMSVFATNVASMIGIGVAVDYSLFILARYREEIRAGHEPDEAQARALSSSGTAVVYSGVTVMVALGGLWLIDGDALRSMALGAIIVVAVAVLASVTLLPALMHVMRRRLEGGRGLARSESPAAAGEHPEPGGGGFWERWTQIVMRRPLVSLSVSAALLLALAAPALSLKPGENLLRQLPEGNDTLVGYQHAAALEGEGAASPVQVLIRFRERAERAGRAGRAERRALARRQRALVARVRRAIARDPEVVRVATARRARDRRLVLVSAIPRAEGDAEPTKALVGRLRERLPAHVPSSQGTVLVGGPTAYIKDFQDEAVGGLWKVALFALAASSILLAMLLHSLVLPLKAAVMNLLSVGAAYGVLVVVFQWGWVDGFLGFQSKGFVDVITLPVVLVVVFGLSMDYEIFLMSRIRERFEQTGDATAAIAQGLATTARTITGAALIMVAVFAVFVGTGLQGVKEVGLGLAVAIAVDATLVRLVLVPSMMQLFGRWNWWLPRPLAVLSGGGRAEPLAEPRR